MTPEELTERLVEIGRAVDGVLAAKARQERLALLAALMAGPLRAALNAAWRSRREEVEAILVRLSGGPGMGQPVAQLRATLARAAKAAAAGLTVFGAGDEVSPVFRATIGGREVLLDVPAGWTCGDDGVHRLVQARGADGGLVLERKRVSHAPIVLTRRFREPGGSTRYVEVAWMEDGTWSTKRVSRGVIAQARELAQLAHDGAPVTTETAGQVVAWLADLEAENSFPAAWVSTHMGWQGAKLSHLLVGRRLHAAEGSDVELELLDETDAGLHQLAGAIRPAGTWRGWLDALDDVGDRPLAWAAVYASCAAPLLEILDCPCFFANFFAASGQGKSSVLELGASVWGDPVEGRGYLRSWQSTAAGIEGYASALASLPICLDETNKVPLAGRAALASTIYVLGSGSGKLRGALGGATRRTVTWRSVMLSTGEQSLTSFTEDQGTRGRCLSLPGAPLRSADQAEALVRGVRRHHGHLGPRVADALVGLGEAGRAELRERYEGLVRDYGAEAQSPTGRRVAQYMAALALAAAVVHESCGVPRPACDALGEIWGLVDDEAAEADRPTAALRGLAQWALARPGQLATWGGGGRAAEGHTSTPSGGAEWIGRLHQRQGWEWLALTTGATEDWLRRHGHEPGAILRVWADRGWIQRDGKHLTKPTGLPGSVERVRMYRLPRAALDAVGAIGGADDDDG